jgi:hypothetical protein
VLTQCSSPRHASTIAFHHCGFSTKTNLQRQLKGWLKPLQCDSKRSGGGGGTTTGQSGAAGACSVSEHERALATVSEHEHDARRHAPRAPPRQRPTRYGCQHGLLVALEPRRRCQRGSGYNLGTGSDGLRGLIATCVAKPGDVLLEVPLACCLSDFGAGEAAVEPPSWANGMKWTVQLACSVLAQRAANSPLLADWPEAPPVPLLCDADELSLACDEALASRVREQRLWALGQCALALGAAETAADTEAATTLATPQQFLEAVALVQSRALLLKIPRPIGMRRLLVPGLDLSNHAEQPTALYTFSPTRGGVVRLHLNASCGAT